MPGISTGLKVAMVTGPTLIVVFPFINADGWLGDGDPKRWWEEKSIPKKINSQNKEKRNALNFFTCHLRLNFTSLFLNLRFY